MVIETVYDRTELVDQVIDTVEHNLVAGAILVIAILFLLLGNVRAGLLVAAAIPLSMLFAGLGMWQMGIAASLLSLGAMDFGILVDGSVVMTEANLRRLTERQLQLGRDLTAAERMSAIVSSSREVVRPIAFGMGIIVLVFLPVLTLQGIEGKMFRPMAWTFIFALVGALLVAVFLSPILSFQFLPKRFNEHEGRAEGWLKRIYLPALTWVLHRRTLTLGVAAALVLVTGCADPAPRRRVSATHGRRLDCRQRSAPGRRVHRGVGGLQHQAGSAWSGRSSPMRCAMSGAAWGVPRSPPTRWGRN